MIDKRLQDLPVKYSRDEIVKIAQDYIKKGGIVYFKFICQSCGKQVNFFTPNTFYESGTCIECGKLTFPNKFGIKVIGGEKK